MQKSRIHQQGFTLIELSIVLVIIGLLVGGVLVGQNIIKGAQIRSTLTQLDKINTAVNVFQNKFNGLPGETTGTGLAAAPQGTGGSNNVLGNGMIESCTGGNGLLLGCENVMFWNHLTTADAAELLEGRYTGAGTTGSSYASPNALSAAVPPTKAGKGNFVHIQGTNGINYYRLAAIASVTTGTITAANGFVPSDAANIDTKLDDGVPNAGTVVVRDDAAGATTAVMTDT